MVLFLIVAGQIAAGAYILNLNIRRKLEDAWFLDTEQGEQRRQEYQEYMECCGFEYITDSQPEYGGSRLSNTPSFVWLFACLVCLLVFGGSL